MARHAKSQLLYLQMIMLKVDSEYARYILSVHTARFNYTQPLNNNIYTPCEYSFEMNPFCHAPTINDFEILAEFNVLQNPHLCAQKSVCATTLEPFGETGAIFSLQLPSRNRFDKFNRKKVIAEDQCEKHPKSS